MATCQKILAARKLLKFWQARVTLTGLRMMMMKINEYKKIQGLVAEKRPVQEDSFFTIESFVWGFAMFGLYTIVGSLFI